MRTGSAGPTPDAKVARWSLAIAALTLTVQNGIVTAFAVLYLPLVGEFGGSRAEVAAIQSTVFLLGGVGAPLIGHALDRLGPRRLFQGAAVVAALGLLAASRAAGLPFLLLTYGVIGGLGLAALGSQANMVVAALWYPNARGKAIAVADLGTGLGAFCLLPVAQTLVVLYGWRTTVLVWAGLLLAILVPVNAFQKLPPRTRAEGPARGADRWSVASAVRSRSFWWLCSSRFFSSIGFPLMNVHMLAFAVGVGIPPVQAAAALGTVSLISLGGRLMTGWLADRLGRAQTLTLTYSSAGLGIVCLFLLARSGWPGWLLFYVIFYGLAQGSSGIVTSARAADIFAGPRFATILGFIVLAAGPGEAIGAWAGGAIYDVTGSYLWAFGFVLAVLALGAWSIWRVPPSADPFRSVSSLPRRST